MLLNRNEPVMAKPQEIERKDEFLQYILNELETFNLKEQNYILKTIYQSIKEHRICELKELKVKADNIDKAITELG